jgi:hypothetical protein
MLMTKNHSRGDRSPVENALGETACHLVCFEGKQAKRMDPEVGELGGLSLV